MKNLISAKEIRDQLDITSQTLNNWRKAGKIKYVQINQRNFLYDIESLGIQVMVMINDDTEITNELTKKINEYIDSCIQKILNKKRLDILKETKKIIEQLILEEEENV